MIYKDGYFVEFSNPFTHIFSLFSSNLALLNVNSFSEMIEINCHINDASEILLQGLQSLKYVISTIDHGDRMMIKSLNHLEFFVTAINNLIVALNKLRKETNDLHVTENYLN